MPRKYNYTYDNVGRFTAANFTQKESPTATAWANNKMDFTVNNISYDDNSNLLTMWQRGISPGDVAPKYIDKLQYTYKTVSGSQWSNQLYSVFDNNTDMTVNTNGTLGDFKDETYGQDNKDYEYDENGNLITDNNKSIRTNNGIEYNYLDKPQKITFSGANVIDFTYDADGTKLSKSVTSKTGALIKTTWYIGAYTFEEKPNNEFYLQNIIHEEGRIRVTKPNPNPRVTIGNNFNVIGNELGVYEYFVKDQLQSVRMVLTEESHSEYHNCTMEKAPSPTGGVQPYEEQNFGQINANGTPATNNEVVKTRVAKSVANGWTLGGADNQFVAKLQKNNNPIGPNMLLKVMAGDLVSTQVNYYYNVPATNQIGNYASTLTPIIINAITNNSVAASVKDGATAITTNLNTNTDYLSFLNNQSQPNSTVPDAYLNVLFFDENFNFIPQSSATGLGSTGIRVVAGGDAQPALNLINLKTPKNGYAYIYISNNSNIPVFFDNLAVTHNRGQIVEENHYYAYGLRIKGLGGRAIEKGQNKYGYQGAYSEEEEETGYNEFDLRMYNPQTGVWNGADPMDEFASPYIGMGANPVNNVDPSGGSILSSITGVSNIFFNTSVTTILGAFVGGIVGFFNGDNNAALKGAVIGASLGLLDGVSGNISLGGLSSSSGVDLWDAVGLGVDLVSEVSSINQSNSGDFTLNTGTSECGCCGGLWSAIKSGASSVYEGVVSTARVINTYVNPLTPFVELATGKSVESDFTKDKDRSESTLMAIITVIPGGKIGSTGLKIFEKVVIKDVVKVVEKDLLKTAKKWGINASSPTSKQVLDNLEMKASEWVAKYRNGSVKSILGDTGEKTLFEVFDAANSTTRKMLLNGRFAK